MHIEKWRKFGCFQILYFFCLVLQHSSFFYAIHSCCCCCCVCIVGCYYVFYCLTFRLFVGFSCAWKIKMIPVLVLRKGLSSVSFISLVKSFFLLLLLVGSDVNVCNTKETKKNELTGNSKFLNGLRSVVVLYYPSTKIE